MKKVFLLSLFAAVAVCFAHGVLLLAEDNKDGTIYIEAGLSTGGSAEGASVVLKEKSTGKPIFTSTIPPEGHINIEQPKVPYTITVRLSEGHEITKAGPLAEENGKNIDLNSHSHDGGKTYHSHDNGNAEHSHNKDKKSKK